MRLRFVRSWQESRVFATWPHWQDLCAVRQGRVFVLDGNAYQQEWAKDRRDSRDPGPLDSARVVSAGSCGCVATILLSGDANHSPSGGVRNLSVTSPRAPRTQQLFDHVANVLGVLSPLPTRTMRTLPLIDQNDVRNATDGVEIIHLPFLLLDGEAVSQLARPLVNFLSISCSVLA